MAYGGVAKDGVLPGPWDTWFGKGSMYWGWSRDETIPVLIPDTEEGVPQEPKRVQAGPWAPKLNNPFEREDWLPLSETLLPQGKFGPSLLDISVLMPPLINEDKFVGLKTPHDLFGMGEAKTGEPSHC